MKITRNIDGEKHAIKLTHKEINKAAAVFMSKTMKRELPGIMLKQLVADFGADVDAWDDQTGVDINTLLDADYQKTIVLPIAVEELDADTSVKEALRRACKVHNSSLKWRMRLLKHFSDYHDNLMPLIGGNGNETFRQTFQTAMACNTYIDLLSEFCEKNPDSPAAQSIIMLDDAINDGRAMAMFAELAYMAIETEMDALSPADCAAIATASMFDDQMDSEEDIKRARAEMFATAVVMCFMAQNAGMSVSDFCQQAFGCTLKNAFDAHGDKYLAGVSDETYDTIEMSPMDMEMDVADTLLEKMDNNIDAYDDVCEAIETLRSHKEKSQAIHRLLSGDLSMLNLLFGQDEDEEDDAEPSDDADNEYGEECNDTDEESEPDGAAPSEDDCGSENPFANDLYWDEEEFDEETDKEDDE